MSAQSQATPKEPVQLRAHDGEISTLALARLPMVGCMVVGASPHLPKRRKGLRLRAEHAHGWSWGMRLPAVCDLPF